MQSACFSCCEGKAEVDRETQPVGSQELVSQLAWDKKTGSWARMGGARRRDSGPSRSGGRPGELAKMPHFSGRLTRGHEHIGVVLLSLLEIVNLFLRRITR